ncbi:MAG: glycosyltransferase family 4 protein [Pseudomonadota bacterium]|jgi:glycosyltransferase involved in cell wall biosynthesis|nr:glycosyltransferase family 4 protein [Pseudomonadota bacterium]
MKFLFADSTTRGYGTEQHGAALAIALARRGHTVRCVVRGGGSVEAILRQAGVSCIAVAPGAASSLRLVLRTISLARRERPDWLVTGDGRFHWVFMGLRRLARARVAFFRHWPVVPKSSRTRRMLAHRADRFILVSRFHREEYHRQGMNVARAAVLYNPIDTDLFHPSAKWRAQTRARHGIGASDVLIGYAGRMVREKGIFAMFEALEPVLSEFEHARVLWVGDGRDLDELRSRAASSAHAARHRFLDWQLEMAQFYPACDLIVVPSVGAETFGRVSVEAQSAAVPVVVSDAGGLRETLVPGVTGLITPGGDSGALAAAIRELLADRERRERMGAAGRAWVCANFSFAQIARHFEALLSEDAAREQRLAAPE